MPAYVKPSELPPIERGTTPKVRFSDLRRSMLPVRGSDRGDLVQPNASHVNLVVTLKAAPTPEEPVAATFVFPVVSSGVAEKVMTAAETDLAGMYHASARLIDDSTNPDTIIPAGQYLWLFTEAAA